jgi:hypothetical protein
VTCSNPSVATLFATGKTVKNQSIATRVASYMLNPDI